MRRTPREINVQGGNVTYVAGGDYILHDHRQSGPGSSDETRKQEALKKLFDHIAPGALHNSADRHDPPKCHPRTREAVISTIMNWAKDPKNFKLLMWIYGPAGAGKSAIMQTVIERLVDEGFLGASFFFFRTADRRNTKTHLIPTLAYQLALKVLRFSDHIAAVIQNDPSIFSRNMSSQMRELILKPMSLAFADNPDLCHCQWLFLLMIDGLDECSPDESHKEIITVLSELAVFPFRVVIASRPEFVIRDTFSLQSMQQRTQMLALDSTYHPDNDIRILLVDRFNQIKDRYPLRHSIPNAWPSQNQINTLVNTASGQFIYAATVLKFIDSPRHSPLGRLDTVLRARLSVDEVDTPFAQLDALYHQIFASVHDITKVLHILHCINHCRKHHNWHQPVMLELLLGYSAGETQIILCDMHSLLHVTDDHFDEIRPHHTSLRDFLYDPLRAKHLYSTPEDIHTFLATCFVRQFHRIQNTVNVHISNTSYWEDFVKILLAAAPSEEMTNEMYKMDIFKNMAVEEFDFAAHTPSRDALIDNMNLFYSWLYRKTQALYGPALYDWFVDRLDRWLAIILSRTTTLRKDNWLILLVSALRTTDLSTATDILQLHVWFRTRKESRQTRQESTTGLLRALSAALNETHRHTYKALENNEHCSNHFMSYMIQFYANLENHPGWISPGNEHRVNNHFQSPFKASKINWNHYFAHWARTLQRLLPVAIATRENGLMVNSIYVGFQENDPQYNFSWAQTVQAYIEDREREDGQSFSTHDAYNGIEDVKKELRSLAIVALTYLQRCGMQHAYNCDPPAGRYNMNHRICFRCQSSDEFLQDDLVLAVHY